MYYKFHGDDLEDEAAFDQRMDSLTREIGKRGLDPGRGGGDAGTEHGKGW